MFFLRNNRYILWCFVFLLVGMQWHCGTTASRYSSPHTATKKQSAGKKSSRFAPQIKEEVEQDDKKVDIGKVKSRFAVERKAHKKTDRNHKNKESGKKEQRQEIQKQPGTQPHGALTKAEHDKAMEEILSMLGVPYLWGGEDENGIDCSAFTRRVFHNAFTINLPRTAKQQVDEGTVISQTQLKFGDLVFFNTTGENPSHVGIYIDDDLFAHASESFGVTISSLESSYYKDRYTGARRILQ